MEDSNKLMRECVVNFDKSLSLKLNRSALTSLANELKSSFLPIKRGEYYLDQFENVHERIKAQDSKFDVAVSNYEQRIDGIIEERIGR